MKILNVKINSFGKLANKEIELKDNINIIYGKNESGKSTLLKFIIGMFYGLSKNKNGKFISEYEKYTPWSKEEFSGKISYELDNKEKYEVYREFKKKNPKIFNSQLEDISKEFNIDKTNGNQFFYDQTKVPKELFISTIVSEQEEVKLDDKTQNTLVQKMANLVGTGDDNTSFNKIINKLNKKQLEEIGTLRSQDRPINLITKRIEEVKQQKEYLKQYADKKYEIEEEKQAYQKQISKLETKLEILKELREIKEKENIEKEKLNVSKNIETNYNEKIEELNNKLEGIKTANEVFSVKRKSKQKFKIHIAIICILIILSICSFLFINKELSIGIGILTFIYFAIFSYKHNKNKMLIHNKEKTRNVEIEDIKKEIQLLQNTHSNAIKEIEKQEQNIDTVKYTNLNYLKNKYKDISKEIDELYQSKTTQYNIDILQANSNENKIKLYTLELQEQNILPKLENMSELEEEEKTLEEEYNNLEFNNKSINLAKEEIQIAYNQMKENVTPKFTTNLSKIISKVSNNKYNNVKFDEKNGIIIEIENGDYISAKNLSVGTIDQLYLSLRLGASNEISKEKLPILLDEAFAYYDSQRLANILTYINEEYKDRQIIIFTCTNREKEILDKLNIQYNLIEM